MNQLDRLLEDVRAFARTLVFLKEILENGSDPKTQTAINEIQKMLAFTLGQIREITR